MNEIKDGKCLTSYLALGKCLFPCRSCLETHFYLNEVDVKKEYQPLVTPAR